MNKKLTSILAVPILITAFFTSPLAANSTPAPVLGPSGGPGTYQEQNIGAELFGDSSNYRIPALAHLGDGVVLAAWDGRPGSAADSPNPNSIVLRRSLDNGQTWGPYSYIARGNLGTDGTQRYGYSDPSFVVDNETGKVFAFFVYSQDQGWQGSQYGNDTATDRNIIGAVVVESSDRGVSWSTPRDITSIVKPGQSKTNPQPGDVKSVFATSGAGIQLQYGAHRGRLIQQYAGRVRQSNGSEITQAYSVYSDDHGVTWKRGEFVGTAMDENKTVELSDGTVLLNSRDSANSGYRKVAKSTDGGHSWSAVELDQELPDPTNNASIIRMYPDAPQGSADAKKLIFTNSNNNANWNRVNLSARVSCDDGQTWPGLRQIKPGFGAYSSAAVLDDGKFGVFYEANYNSDMRFGSFDEDWLNFVCAPLAVGQVAVNAGSNVSIPVTITNQETEAITGSLTIADATGFTGENTSGITVQPGESQTVNVTLNAAATARSGKLDAVFTEANGKQSRHTFNVSVQGELVDLNVNIINATAVLRDVTEQPYQVGEKIQYNIRVVNNSSENVLVTPSGGNFDTGFLVPGTPNCRWRNLPANDAYNCTTAKHTVTEEDVNRGYFIPEMVFNVSSVANPSHTTVVQHTGNRVNLRAFNFAATANIEAEAVINTEYQNAGDRITVLFRVANPTEGLIDSVPSSGNLDESGFLPTGAPNCRYRSLPAGGNYTCTSARYTITEEDLERGYVDIEATFNIRSHNTNQTQEVSVSERFTVTAAPEPEVPPATPEPEQPPATPEPVTPIFADSESVAAAIEAAYIEFPEIVIREYEITHGTQMSEVGDRKTGETKIYFEGLPPNTKVTIFTYSVATENGTGMTDENGLLEVSLTDTSQLDAGEHYVVAQSAGDSPTVAFAILLVESAEPDDPTTAEDPSDSTNTEAPTDPSTTEESTDPTTTEESSDPTSTTSPEETPENPVIVDNTGGSTAPTDGAAELGSTQNSQSKPTISDSKAGVSKVVLASTGSTATTTSIIALAIFILGLTISVPRFRRETE